jgi:hypothetical protein
MKSSRSISKSNGRSKRNSRRTRGLKRPAGRQPFAFENLEPRHVLTTLSFVDTGGALDPGYKGTQDTLLFSIRPDTNFGTDTFVSVDQQDVNGARQGLLKFGDIFTATGEPGKIPFGSTITSATVTFSVFNESSSQALISLYPMFKDWDQLTVTWNSFRQAGGVGGVQASEGEAASVADGILFDPTSGFGKTIDVTASLRRWAAGDPNYGWLIESLSTNGWDFDTSENAQTNRPKLEVTFTEPTVGNSGTFRFLDATSVKTEGNLDDMSNPVLTTATIRVARTGGGTGSVSVDYDISGGTATAGADFVDTSGTLVFGPNETIKTFDVTLKGDVSLEGLENIVFSLSNPQNITTPGVNLPAIDAAADDHTLTIGDDDALVNEVLANVFNPTNSSISEANREFVELIGTPGANLGGAGYKYWFVVFEGEEEETGADEGSSGAGPFTANVNGNAGKGVGKADLVIDLSSYSFGANGLLVLTPATWAYTKDPGTNQAAILPADALEDNSQTYALIRTLATTTMVQGFDYDTVGKFNLVVGNPATIEQTTEAGVGVGVLDKLPVDAQIVDAVGVVEGGSGDRDRVATLSAPGVHIHQPIGNEGNVTPDAITRRFGDQTPNSAGPWYNGEITTDSVTEIPYDAAPRQNVVTPAGARLTPGAPNGQTTVGFDVTASTVVENVGGGKVTIMVTRSTNLPSAPLNLFYSTVNGTALAGSDFTGVANGLLSFGPNELVKSFDISITNDTDKESFENFRVTLSNADDPYQIISTTHTVTIEDDDALKKKFQQGTGGYTGSQDATINSRTPDIGLGGPGTAATIIVDEELGSFTGAEAFPAQALIRFDGLFGSAMNQVPEGARILGGFLKVNVVSNGGGSDSDAQIRFFRMLKDWDENQATWNDPATDVQFGVTPDDVEAYADPDFLVNTPAAEGAVSIPINVETLQAWANGVVPNFGWAIIADTGNNWEFSSANDFINPNAFAPELTILYSDPVAEAGTFRFSDTQYRVNEDGTATITVERVGGTTGNATLNFAVTAGTTGSLADIQGTNGTVSTTGTLTFTGGAVKQTFTIQINNDSQLERNEVLNLSLTHASGAGTVDRNSATLTIRDNDFSTVSPSVLLNELYINDPGNDGGHEFIELTGLADSAMGGLYLFVIDGDSGSGLGAADMVIDLGAALNGSNGLSIIHGASGFNDFDVPGATSRILTSLLNTENLANDSTTFVLAYSPASRLSTQAFDYDWDNDGDLDLPTGLVFIDSIAIKDDGAQDRLYGPGGAPAVGNVIDVFASKNYVPDGVSRKTGNTTVNSASAWFHGDLLPTGDDPLVYTIARSTDLPLAPSSGTAITPGEANTSAASGLVSLTSVTPNNPVGTFTLNFSAPVTQLLLGSGGNQAAISLTNPAGNVITGINVVANATGVGSATWTVSFAGPNVVSGKLPPGSYRLNFTGNNLIGNGRAVDTANTATVAGSDRQLLFNVVAAPGDFNLDGTVDAADYVRWRKTDNTPANYTLWRANFGNTSTVVFPASGDGAGLGSSSAEAAALPLAATPQALAAPVLTQVIPAAPAAATVGVAFAGDNQGSKDAQQVSARRDSGLAFAAQRPVAARRPALERATLRKLILHGAQDRGLLAWLAANDGDRQYAGRVDGVLEAIGPERLSAFGPVYESGQAHEAVGAALEELLECGV